MLRGLILRYTVGMGMVQTVLQWHTQKTSWIEKAYIWLLVSVLFGIALHAPLSVGLGTLWPDYALIIKSWKEILLAVAGLLLVVILTTQKKWHIFNSKLFYLIFAFVGLNLLLAPLFFMGPEATLAGLIINLRYLFAFTLVYAAVRLYPQVVPLFLTALAAGAAVVIGFGLLQVTVLPHDILKYIGYSELTIMPYLTVDQNMDFIRINSTLRGPNPLGAYLVIVISLLLAALLQSRKKISKPWVWVIVAAGIVSSNILWVSYSRSAAVAAAVAVGLVALIVYGKRINSWAWIAMCVAALMLAGGLIAARDTSFVSNVILHEDPAESGLVNSNDEHVNSLVDGLTRMLRQPFGGGIGSTGSASIHTDKPLIIENQYLFIAHETGWLGLGLFLVITALLMIKLWTLRKNWLSLGVFASGVGLILIGVLLPVWVDDTVSIVWWSLAGMAIAQGYSRKAAKNVR